MHAKQKQQNNNKQHKQTYITTTKNKVNCASKQRTQQTTYTT